MERRVAHSKFLGLAIGWLIVASPAQGDLYALIRLQELDPNDPHSWSRAIDERGVVVGASTVSGGSFHAAVWIGNAPVDLGTIDGARSEAKGLNTQGHVVGESTFAPGSLDEHAFLWKNGQMIDLGTLGGDESGANAINDIGQIVGFAEAAVGGGPSIWENDQVRALPTLGQDGGTAFDINNSGQIVGWSVASNGSQMAALWENGEVFALPSLRRDPSAAIAINELGWIVGQSKVDPSTSHGAAWLDGEVYDLHKGGLGAESSAWGINDLGQIVGWVGQPYVSQHAFLWEFATGMRYIDDLVPPRLREPWTITMAHDINDAGQIATYGIRQGDPLTLVGFLVSPVHPTMVMSDPAPGSAGVTNTFSVSNAPPGAKVYFTFSFNGGGARIPGCDLQQNALQLNDPKIVGSAIADANGNASIQRFVPNAASGKTILFQAVILKDCAISQLVVHQFE